MNDPTRPFVTNSVITDGQNFKLSTYQLNKTCLISCDEDSEEADFWPRNVLWHLPEQKLYEGVDDEGNVEGFNREVLRDLIKFYLVKPTIKAEDVDNEGFLGENKSLINLEEDYDRQYFHASHRFVLFKKIIRLYITFFLCSGPFIRDGLGIFLNRQS